MKKIGSYVINVVFVCMIAIVVVLWLPSIFHIQTYRVLSGSMQPSYPVGSVVYVKSVDPQSIDTGDVITFQLSGGTLVTHRVVEINQETQTFTTKGDANEMEDGGGVAFESVKGKVIFFIPLLGYVCAYLSTRIGIITVISVMALLLALSLFLDWTQKKKALKNE